MAVLLVYRFYYKPPHRQAKGEYVLFLDSYDWLDRNTLYLLYENIKNSDMLLDLDKNLGVSNARNIGLQKN